MTTEETEVVRLVIEALSAPRDRLGRIIAVHTANERIRKLLLKINAPNGGLDTIDQCRMVLQGLIGDEITSIH